MKNLLLPVLVIALLQTPMVMILQLQMHFQARITMIHLALLLIHRCTEMVKLSRQRNVIQPAKRETMQEEVRLQCAVLQKI